MSDLRLSYWTLSAEAYQGFIQTKNALAKSSLGIELIELVYLRISQMNGCAFCLEMHSKALRAKQVPQAKLDSLAGWRVSANFSERERAVLNWTESLVNVAETHAPDSDYDELKKLFNESEISDLNFAIALMSAFNRLAIGARQ